MRLLSDGDRDRRAMTVADHQGLTWRANMEGRQSNNDGDAGLVLGSGLSGFVVGLCSVRPF